MRYSALMTIAGSGWPSSLLPESPREALAPGQRRRLCERWLFRTSNRLVRSGKDGVCASQTGWSCSDPPWRHSTSCPDAFSTGSGVLTLADSSSFSCGRSSVFRSKRSFTGCPRFCLQPRFRSFAWMHGTARIESAPIRHRSCGTAWHRFAASHAGRCAASQPFRSNS